MGINRDSDDIISYDNMHNNNTGSFVNHSREAL